MHGLRMCVTTCRLCVPHGHGHGQRTAKKHPLNPGKWNELDSQLRTETRRRAPTNCKPHQTKHYSGVQGTYIVLKMVLLTCRLSPDLWWLSLDLVVTFGDTICHKCSSRYKLKMESVSMLAHVPQQVNECYTLRSPKFLHYRPYITL